MTELAYWRAAVLDCFILLALNVVVALLRFCVAPCAYANGRRRTTRPVRRMHSARTRFFGETTS